jgi:hypothetical protein
MSGTGQTGSVYAGRQNLLGLIFNPSPRILPLKKLPMAFWLHSSISALPKILFSKEDLLEKKIFAGGVLALQTVSVSEHFFSQKTFLWEKSVLAAL